MSTTQKKLSEPIAIRENPLNLNMFLVFFSGPIEVGTPRISEISIWKLVLAWKRDKFCWRQCVDYSEKTTGTYRNPRKPVELEHICCVFFWSDRGRNILDFGISVWKIVFFMQNRYWMTVNGHTNQLFAVRWCWMMVLHYTGTVESCNRGRVTSSNTKTTICQGTNYKSRTNSMPICGETVTWNQV